MRVLAVAVLVIATLSTAGVSLPMAPPVVKMCTATQRVTTGCPVASSSHSSVTVTGERTSPARQGVIPDGGTRRIESSEENEVPADQSAECVLNFENRHSCPALAKPGDPVPADPATPAITITDVASFAPPGTLAAAEPNNLGIAGLPANFVANATTRDVTGALFETPVTVRFTPVSYVFDFGDGTVITTNTGGTTWEQLGQAQFTPTPTSHTYLERGTYDARVDIHYAAEVDLGSGWIPLNGTVTSQGPIQPIRIFEAHTALVAHTCTEAPSSPGC